MIYVQGLTSFGTLGGLGVGWLATSSPTAGWQFIRRCGSRRNREFVNLSTFTTGCHSVEAMPHNRERPSSNHARGDPCHQTGVSPHRA